MKYLDYDGLSYLWNKLKSIFVPQTRTVNGQALSGDVNITDIDGNSGTATKLETARTIALNTGATGTATSFDGSGDIAIPVTAVKENYLTWGTKEKYKNYGVTPIGLAMCGDHRNNRLDFINPKAIKIERSDDGETWVNHWHGNNEKIQLCTTGLATSVNSGYLNGCIKGSYARITITAQDGTLSTPYFYISPVKLLINYNNEAELTIETRKGNTNTWVTYGTFNIYGAPSWCDIPFGIGNWGGTTSQTGNIWQVRFTFKATTTSGTQIRGLRVYSEQVWNHASDQARYGSLYTYDYNKNATFPAKVTATSFVGSLTGNATTATTATKATQDANGNNIVDTYATKQELANFTYEDIERILKDGLTNGSKTISEDGTVITTVDSDGRTLVKTFTNNFLTSTSVLTNQNGDVLGTMVKEMTADGRSVNTTITT